MSSGHRLFAVTDGLYRTLYATHRASHFQCWSWLVEHPEYPEVLILEDDATFWGLLGPALASGIHPKALFARNKKIVGTHIGVAILISL